MEETLSEHVKIQLIRLIVKCKEEINQSAGHSIIRRWRGPEQIQRGLGNEGRATDHGFKMKTASFALCTGVRGQWGGTSTLGGTVCVSTGKEPPRK